MAGTMASAPDPFALRASGPPDEEDLAGLATRLSYIAAALQRVAADGHPPYGARSKAYPFDDRAALCSLARHAYALRRQRAAIFGSAELFGEPAWDILLDLYIAHAEGKQVSVSSACIGSGSPPTTGLRWLTVLADKGLIAREADDRDHRRIMVRLTEAGIAAMERFLTLAAQRPSLGQPKQPRPA
jgi:hypothetical protein